MHALVRPFSFYLPVSTSFDLSPSLCFFLSSFPRLNPRYSYDCGLAVIMAQLGCRVPAQSLRMSPVDSIFTRLGAHDSIAAGKSTFMCELVRRGGAVLFSGISCCSQTETSRMLSRATRHSLLALDELGRGTSTFDGHAVAFAVLQHIVDTIGCVVLCGPRVL
jgi:DNA mismatch repair ATPase MutS